MKNTFKDMIVEATKAAKIAAHNHIVVLLKAGPAYAVVEDIGLNTTSQSIHELGGEIGGVVGRLRELCGFVWLEFSGKNRKFISEFKKVANEKRSGYFEFVCEYGGIAIRKNSYRTGYTLWLGPLVNGPMEQGMNLKAAAYNAVRDSIADVDFNMHQHLD